MRSIGMDVHRSVAQVAIFADGAITENFRVDLEHDAVVAFGRSLRPDDEVVLEATGNTAAIVRLLLSAAPEQIAHRSKLRLAYVEAFLEFETKQEIKRTDAAIEAAMGWLQMRVTEILGLQNRDERGDRNICVLAKPVSASALRRWLKGYEAEGLDGLFDALHRSGNRSRKIGLEELGVMGPLVERCAREDVPKETIVQDVRITFEDLFRRLS